MFENQVSVPDEPAGVNDAPLSPAVQKFRSCRWRAQSDGAPSHHCAHRDVLPFAGRTGFTPEAWCPDCVFYKLRRTPKKREMY